MRRAVDIGWLNQAICFCRSSAAAYKSAFMLASDPCHERRLLELCTARYALLERLLGELAASVGAAHLRRLLEPGGDDLQPTSLEAALTTALIGDCRLTQMFGPDLATLTDYSTAPAAAGSHTPLQSRAAGACLPRQPLWQPCEDDHHLRATSP